MVIIVEGIDRVGKTILCNMLKEVTGYKILKKEREASPVVADADIEAYINYGNANAIVQMIEQGYLDNVIIDRFHWTEAVYGKLNRKCDLAHNLMSKVEDYMVEKVLDKVIMIYVRPVDIAKSEKEHGSDLHSHLSLYEAIVKYTRLQLIITNYDGLQETAKRINTYKNLSKVKPNYDLPMGENKSVESICYICNNKDCMFNVNIKRKSCDLYKP